MSTREYFAQVAERWDTLRSGYFGEEVRDAALAAAGAALNAESTVADIGTGTGFIAAGLAPRARRGIALDPSPEMLDAARRNLAAFDNVEFVDMPPIGQDGRPVLPLADGSVDAAFANMVLHHAPDPAAAIAEMARILKPGGKLVITDSDRHDHEWMRTEMADVWLGFDSADVRRWFEAAGLGEVTVDCTGQSCCATSQSEGEQASISVFVASGTRPPLQASADAEDDVRDAVREYYAARARAAGGSCCGPSIEQSHPVQPARGEAIELLPSASSCCASTSSCCAPGAIDFGDRPADAETGTPPSWGCGNPTALAELKPGQVVLDLGSGAGYDAFLAAKQVAPGGRVIGVDMTPEMLELARGHAERLGLGGSVEFRQGHIEALPVDDASVDVILSNCVVNLSPDKDAVFQEAHRVLKPGGWLAISDIVTEGSLPDFVRRNIGLWAGCVGGAIDESEYLGKVRAAGFERVEIGGRESYVALPGARILSLTFRAFKPEVNG